MPPCVFQVLLPAFSSSGVSNVDLGLQYENKMKRQSAREKNTTVFLFTIAVMTSAAEPWITALNLAMCFSACNWNGRLSMLQ